MPLSDREFDILKTITQIETSLRSVVDSVKRLDDINEGTVERKGMKERIALAEHEITEHKKAWLKNETALKDMEVRINTTLREAFTEINRTMNKKFDAIDIAIDAINKNVGEQKGFIGKVKPYMDIIVWVITLVAGWFIVQVLSGNMQIVRVP